MTSDVVSGVLLYEDAIASLGDAIKPYLRRGPIGHYIYCQSVAHDGPFIVMEFLAKSIGGGAKDNMRVWLPMSFVKMVVSASPADLPVGFTTTGQQPT